jgi:hypothetical protein
VFNPQLPPDPPHLRASFIAPFAVKSFSLRSKSFSVPSVSSFERASADTSDDKKLDHWGHRGTRRS